MHSFLTWNQSIVQCPFLTVASWPAYRFLRRQVSISLSIFHSFLWSTQDPHILLGICWVSWMCRFTCYIKFGEFWTIISSNILCVPFSLFSHYTYIGMIDGVQKVSSALFDFIHSFFFLSLKLGIFNWSIFKFTIFFFFLLKSAFVIF